VRFLYDRTVFAAEAAFEADTIRTRLRELAFLNPSATILLRLISASSSVGGGAATASPAALRAANRRAREAALELATSITAIQSFGLDPHVSHVSRWQPGDPITPLGLTPGAAAATAGSSGRTAARRRKARSSSGSGSGCASGGEADAADAMALSALTTPVALHPASLDGAITYDGCGV
jgi:hypothetical protein